MLHTIIYYSMLYYAVLYCSIVLTTSSPTAVSKRKLQFIDIMVGEIIVKPPYEEALVRGAGFGIQIDVCEKNTPPEKKTCRKNSFQNTELGGGQQFLLLDCRARACTKGVFFSQTPVGPADCNHCNRNQEWFQCL